MLYFSVCELSANSKPNSQIHSLVKIAHEFLLQIVFALQAIHGQLVMNSLNSMLGLFSCSSHVDVSLFWMKIHFQIWTDIHSEFLPLFTQPW